MLLSLEIRNFVLIDKLKIRFANGFNVLTGETGAGKSIIINALELITGEKGSVRAVAPGSDKLVVIGVFEIAPSHKEARELLASWGAQIENNEIALRREITADGKSRSFVNLASVRVTQLKELGELLVDIHGQHEHQSLLNAKYHAAYYDAFVGAGEIALRYKTEYRALLDEMKRYEEIKQNRDALMRERTFLEYAVEEIEKAALKENEENDVRAEINMLNNFEKMSSAIGRTHLALYGAENGASVSIGRAMNELSELSEYDARLREAQAIVEEISYRLDDAKDLIGDVRREARFKPERLEELNQRLFTINSLKKKYGQNAKDIAAYYAEAKNKLAMLNFSEEDIATLKTSIETRRTNAGVLAKQLSELRASKRNEFVTRIESEVHDLGMTQTAFDVDILNDEDATGLIEIDGARYKATEQGIDAIEFLIAPNKGSLFEPLRKIASGGEISRIMLALKTVLSQGDFTETMVFDEIDVGVGGRIAEIIGEKLNAVSKRKQTIVITHLAQIASQASAHFRVTKDDSGARSVSRIERLADRERVDEIARMLAGKHITETTIRHAEEMLQSARQEDLFAKNDAD